MLKVFVKNRCKHIHINREISVMDTGGISWTNDFEKERMAVMKKHLSYYEIYKYRVIPMKMKEIKKFFDKYKRK